jgi:uncharacterized membrane protein
VGGSLAAFLVGSLALCHPFLPFPTALLSFYAIGSTATRVGAARKRALEANYDVAGRRTAKQVLASSFWPSMLLVFCFAAYGGTDATKVPLSVVVLYVT